jgi:hypothetical protein
MAFSPAPPPLRHPQITVKPLLKVFFWGPVDTNTKLKKTYNGGNLAISLLTLGHFN